jgi:16S rRNA (uracil1498-N3)-methyltransferase
MRRFLIRPDAVDGRRVRFDPGETRHLRRVLRLGPGDLVEAVDGAGRLHAVRIETLDPAGATGAIIDSGVSGRESPCAITLGQAVLKGERMDWLVQKATELGVTRIVPLLTRRVVARPAGERPARWTRIAREAVKQCGRSLVPVVEPPRPLDLALGEIDSHDVTWLLSGGGAPIRAAAGMERPPARLMLLVGPEGGFEAAELDRAVAAGARLVSLGTRVLRAESAGLVAVALCQYLFGDLGGRPPGSTESAADATTARPR